MQDETLKVYGLFKNNFTGFDNRVCISDLENISGLSNRDLRKAIEELKVIHHIPVVGLLTGGYFLADKDNDIDFEHVQRYLISQKSRIKKMAQGLKAFKSFFPKHQLELKLDKVSKKIDVFLNECLGWCNE
jgi:hypothetical protein